MQEFTEYTSNTFLSHTHETPQETHTTRTTNMLVSSVPPHLSLPISFATKLATRHVLLLNRTRSPGVSVHDRIPKNRYSWSCLLLLQNTCTHVGYNVRENRDKVPPRCIFRIEPDLVIHLSQPHSAATVRHVLATAYGQHEHVMREEFDSLMSSDDYVGGDWGTARIVTTWLFLGGVLHTGSAHEGKSFHAMGYWISIAVMLGHR
jgi:hypothetical protein